MLGRRPPVKSNLQENVGQFEFLRITAENINPILESVLSLLILLKPIVLYRTFTLNHLPKRNKSLGHQKDLNKNIHSSFAHNTNVPQREKGAGIPWVLQSSVNN
jgi:hypothetical protein